MTDPAYTITGQPANTEAALADALTRLEAFAADFQPLTARQRDEKREVMATIDNGRRFLPGYVAPTVPVPVALVSDPDDVERLMEIWQRGRTLRERGERV